MIDKSDDGTAPGLHFGTFANPEWGNAIEARAKELVDSIRSEPPGASDFPQVEYTDDSERPKTPPQTLADYFRGRLYR
jgi:hypothetical protein